MAKKTAKTPPATPPTPKQPKAEPTPKEQPAPPEPTPAPAPESTPPGVPATEYVQRLEAALAAANQRITSSQRLLSRYMTVNLSLAEEGIELKKRVAELEAQVELLQRKEAK